jgi:hypothetical protein
MSGSDYAIAAESLLDELLSRRLEVVKIPSGDGYIRVPIITNPEWYSKICKRFLNSRKRYPKPRTIIRRCNMIAALNNIISRRYKSCGGLRQDTEYFKRLKPTLRERLEYIRETPQVAVESSNHYVVDSTPW